MVHIIFNVPGIVMLAVAFAVAFGVGSLLGTSAEGPLMVLASPLLIVAELGLPRKENQQAMVPSKRRRNAVLLAHLGMGHFVADPGPRLRGFRLTLPRPSPPLSK